jgi:micrococcal nuclease
LVVAIIDGDTIEVEIAGQRYTLRYIGIDSPESGDEFASEAATANAELVADKVVELENDVSETDRSGRLLRYVWVDDTMVNCELARQGYARAKEYPPDTTYQEFLAQCEQEARAAGRGMWATWPATPTPVTTVEAPGGCLYIGNSNTGVFHHWWCSSVGDMNESNKVCLSSREEAIRRGFRPCGNCRP